MSLFKCIECGFVENTALTDFRTKKCSLCLTGKWHGRFDRARPEALGLVLAPGCEHYLEPVGGWPTPGDAQ